MKILSLLFLLLTPVIEQSYAQQIIERLPRAANVIRRLHNPLRRYMTRLAEETQVTDNSNGCRVFNGDYRICVRSEWLIPEKKMRDSIRLLKEDDLLQEFFHVQEGGDLTLSTEQELLNFFFNLKGDKGSFRASGLSEVFFNWGRDAIEEKSVLIYLPANFYLEIVHIQKSELQRLRYDVRCDFCSGLSWIEVQERPRLGLPHEVLYYSSNDPRDITPRLFDSLLARSFYLPLDQLGASIQRALVQDGGFPQLQF